MRQRKDQPTLFPDEKPHAYSETAPPANYRRVCNRCNKVREGSVGYCPACGCPEFRLVTGETNVT